MNTSQNNDVPSLNDMLLDKKINVLYKSHWHNIRFKVCFLIMLMIGMSPKSSDALRRPLQASLMPGSKVPYHA